MAETKNATQKTQSPADPAGATTSPNTADAAKAKTVKGLEVIARDAVFYRAVREWSPEPRSVKLSELTEEQIAELRNETMLIVRDVDIAD